MLGAGLWVLGGVLWVHGALWVLGDVLEYWRVLSGALWVLGGVWGELVGTGCFSG